MASLTLTDVEFVVNGVDLSAFVRSMSLTYEANQNDATVMGNTTVANLPSLKNWALEVTLKQDFVGAGPDATLFSLVAAAPFPISVKPVKSLATSPTNPVFSSAKAVLTNYPPFGGSVGDLAETTISFVPGEDGDLVRAES